jgi:hypothetical protein
VTHPLRFLQRVGTPQTSGSRLLRPSVGLRRGRAAQQSFGAEVFVDVGLVVRVLRILPAQILTFVLLPPNSFGASHKIKMPIAAQ